MNILQVNSVDAPGGAAKVAWQLFQGCQMLGHDARLAVAHKRSDEPNVLQLPEIPDHAWSQWCDRATQKLQPWNGQGIGVGRMISLINTCSRPRRKIGAWLGHEDFFAPATQQLPQLGSQSPDIIHAHNLHGCGLPNNHCYFDLRVLPWLSRRYPVMISLHDAWLLSGHCSHSFGCDRWQVGCGHCPDLLIPPAIQRDATRFNWRRKQRIYRQSRLYIGTPCRWMMNNVEKSMLAGGIVESRIIPYGIDQDLFYPAHDRRSIRSSLNLPEDAYILLTTGNAMRNNPAKDYETMRAALIQVGEQLPDKKLIFLVLAGSETSSERLGCLDVRFIGYQSEAIVADYYRAADIYIHAAKIDTFPLSVLEALSCGTPVVATQVGGIPEQIQHGSTGFLSPLGDAQSLAQQVITLLQDRNLCHQMGQQAAIVAQRKYSLHQMIQSYVDWYIDILENRARKSTT